MLEEKKIIAFSPKLGISNSTSRSFYPSLDVVLNQILPQNLNSALYAIQRTSYYLKFYSLQSYYIDCSSIISNQKKFLDENDKEKIELKICSENSKIYRFTNTLALKNIGFSNFSKKISIKILINIRNAKFLSIYTLKNPNVDSKSNLIDEKIFFFKKDFTDSPKMKKKNETFAFETLTEDENNIYSKINETYFLNKDIVFENIYSFNNFQIYFKIFYEKDFINNFIKNNSLINSLNLNYTENSEKDNHNSDS